MPIFCVISCQIQTSLFPSWDFLHVTSYVNPNECQPCTMAARSALEAMCSRMARFLLSSLGEYWQDKQRHRQPNFNRRHRHRSHPKHAPMIHFQSAKVPVYFHNFPLAALTLMKFPIKYFKLKPSSGSEWDGGTKFFQPTETH